LVLIRKFDQGIDERSSARVESVDQVIGLFFKGRYLAQLCRRLMACNALRREHWQTQCRHPYELSNEPHGIPTSAIHSTNHPINAAAFPVSALLHFQTTEFIRPSPARRFHLFMAQRENHR
jgi:hypothetical protein